MRTQRNGGSGVGAYPREKVHPKTHAVITTSNQFSATDGTGQTGILFLKSKCNKLVMVNWICFTFSMRSYPTAPSPLHFSTNKEEVFIIKIIYTHSRNVPPGIGVVLQLLYWLIMEAWKYSLTANLHKDNELPLSQLPVAPISHSAKNNRSAKWGCTQGSHYSISSVKAKNQDQRIFTGATIQPNQFKFCSKITAIWMKQKQRHVKITS